MATSNVKPNVEAKSTKKELMQTLLEMERQVEALTEENAKLKDQFDPNLMARVAELAALQKVNSAANSSLQLDATLTLVADTVADVMKADACSIFLSQSSCKLVLKATKGLNPEAVGVVSLRIGEGITGTVAKEGRSIALREASADRRFSFVPELKEERCRSMLSVPMILYAINKLVGVINIQTYTPKDFSEEEISFLETVAGQVAIAIENAVLYEQTDKRLQQKVSELTTLQRVSSLVASSLERHEILNLMTAQAATMSHSNAVTVHLLSEDGNSLEMVASYGLPTEKTNRPRLRLGEGAIGKTVKTRNPVVVENAATEEDKNSLAPLHLEDGFAAAICVPLTARNRTFGSLACYSTEPKRFRADDVQLLSTFADETAIALENARLYEEASRNLAIKSTLLAEMHHRVKNNLQTVAALLSLQSRRTKSEEAALPLRESVARIQSIAIVHELLSKEQIGLAAIGDVAKQIIEMIHSNLVEPGRKIEFELAGNEVKLSSREANIFGLLLNELVSNAVFHAFEDQQNGKIRISAIENNGFVNVTVKDNGKGLPKNFQLERDMGLGLQIVKTLVATDLQGQFTIWSDEGTISTIRFPRSPSWADQWDSLII